MTLGKPRDRISIFSNKAMPCAKEWWNKWHDEFMQMGNRLIY